ncbi:MAG: aminopeptidase P N-terminal domain-containing protein [Planctomycetota bacterium]|nr:aminopeptidase P N-terminal domain-containing protein [Planctomycetota bacterium]
MSDRQPYVQKDFSGDEFRARRESLLEMTGGEGVVVLAGAAATGAFDMFRQTNDFYYLCGVEVPQSYLLLDGRDQTSTLYLPPRDEKLERSEGAVLTPEDQELARQVTGVDRVACYDLLFDDLAGAERVWTPFLPGERRQQCRDVVAHGVQARRKDPWDDWQSREQLFAARIGEQVLGVDLQDVCPLIDQLREVKSESEVALMREAGKLTAAAVLTAMQATQPGTVEYQLVAHAERIFADGGASGGAYRAILASGENIWNAHYFRNNAILEDGQLVLMDYAPDFHGYTSDIGRMWPVGGTYDPLQRELYGFIVEYHKVLLEHIRPGVTSGKVMEEAAEVMQVIVESTSWSSEAYRQAARETLAFRGHLSHGVGMSVHDVGDYGRLPLRPGVVFALDPQMWVPSEQIYIRVEDTVSVTNTGMEVLTSGVPLELDEVEQQVGIAVASPE